MVRIPEPWCHLLKAGEQYCECHRVPLTSNTHEVIALKHRHNAIFCFTMFDADEGITTRVDLRRAQLRAYILVKDVQSHLLCEQTLS